MCPPSTDLHEEGVLRPEGDPGVGGGLEPRADVALEVGGDLDGPRHVALADEGGDVVALGGAEAPDAQAHDLGAPQARPQEQPDEREVTSGEDPSGRAMQIGMDGLDDLAGLAIG